MSSLFWSQTPVGVVHRLNSTDRTSTCLVDGLGTVPVVSGQAGLSGPGYVHMYLGLFSECQNMSKHKNMFLPGCEFRVPGWGSEEGELG